MSTNLPQAVLWDMDGTIVDTEPLWMIAERNMLTAWNAEMRDEDVIDWVGIGLWDLAEEFQRRGVELDSDEIVRRMSAEVSEEIARGNVSWRPGARELLRSLNNAGVVCALVTMSIQSQAREITSLLPPDTFRTIISGDIVARPKPHPDAYVLGAERLGLDASDCVAIEDSVIGCRAAWDSGAVTIGVEHLVSLVDAPTHAVFPTLEGVTHDDIGELFQRHHGTKLNSN